MVDEGLVQRWANEYTQCFPAGDGKSEMLQCQNGTVDDTLTGIGQRAVQIEKDCFHGYPPFCLYAIIITKNAGNVNQQNLFYISVK